MNYDPMSHEEAIINQMPERFALGELMGKTRERFEAHFFDCNECFDDVRLTSEFLDHTHWVLSRKSRTSMQVRIKRSFWRPVPILMSTLFLISLGVIAYQHYRIEELSKARFEAPYFLAGTTRAPEHEKPIVLRGNAQLSLRVEFTASNEFKSYRAELLNEAGKVKASIALNPQEGDDSVSVAIPSEGLKEGKYSLVVIGEQRNGSQKDLGGGSFYLQRAK
jgi:hypothetical protein